MNELQFTNTARQLVADFSNEKNEQQLKAEEVYVVWACKTLQNNKAFYFPPIFQMVDIMR